MDNQEKIKIAITSGIAAVVLLILIVFLAVSGKKDSDQEKLDENITDYAESAVTASSVEADTSALASSSASNETSALSSTEESSEASSESSEDKASEAKSEVTQGTVTTTSSGGSFYKIENATLKNNYSGMKLDIESQLKEMYTYWNDGNMDAVRDLAHLKRFEAMSYNLSGTSDFYYYGEKNSAGSPNGKGLAIYADDQYYFGEWADGARSGQGTWISFYPDYSTGVIKEHLYTGGWSLDLPNGHGQEHVDYVEDKMNKTDLYLQNVIGGFKAGKYDGDMYVMLLTKEGDSTEWVGKCLSGDWEQVLYTTPDKKGEIPVLSGRENAETHIYMTKTGAKNNGVSGIINGGKIKE